MFKPAEERRKYERLPVHHLLKYKIIGEEATEGVLSFVRNISAGGVLFHSDEALPTDKVIEVEVLINFPMRPQPIKVLAKVLRSRPLHKIGGYDVAIEFLDLSDLEREFITKKIADVYAKVLPSKKNNFLPIILIFLAAVAALIWLFIKFIFPLIPHLKK
jgi:hypothetical protein